MKTRRVTLPYVAIGLALVISGCIKPPPDRDNLGPEISVNDKNAALATAISGLDQDKAFHVADNGVILVVDNVMTNSMVRETHQDQVTKIDDQYITYTDYVVETKDFGTGKIKRNGSTATPTATPTPNSSPSPTATPSAAALPGAPPSTVSESFLSLPRSFKKFVRFVETTVSGFIARVSVQPSTAAAETMQSDSVMAEALAPVLDKEQALSIGLESLITKVLRAHGFETMDDPSLATTLGAGAFAGPPSPGTGGSPTPAPSPVTTSRYFGLQVSQERFLTKNCAQLSDCKVPATRIEFTEVKTSGDGSQRKFRWYYEISTQVPGLFTLMEQCLSTVIIQNGVQYPFRECIHVSDFRWGQAGS